MVKRFQGSGKQRDGGAGVVTRRDFRAHVENGGDWRHGAPDINMEPSISVLNNLFSSPTVQGTMEKFATTLSEAGQGFITIGDGYDMGNFNVGDPATPSLKSAFDAAFASPRLVEGGVILVKAGTYRLLETVTVPAGITIMGESRGTIIISNTSEQSMFRIAASVENINLGNTSSTPSAQPIDVVKFFNIVLADNLDGYITSGGFAISTMQTVPMINCVLGSRFECDEVTFLGKIDTNTGGGRPPITSAAIGGYLTGSGASNLIVTNCFFDGIGVPIEFIPDNNILDTVVVDKCRARVFGKTNTTDRENNCFVVMNLPNATLTNNNIVGANASILNAFVQLATATASMGVKPKVVITSNTGGPDGGTIAGDILFSNVATLGSEFTGYVGGNVWGSMANNPWYIILNCADDIGGGDLLGPDSLQIVLNSALKNTTIILNSPQGSSSSFTLTSVPTTNLIPPKLIGIKSGSSYPVVDMTLAAGYTDALGQLAVVFSHVEGVRFRNTTSTAASVMLAPVGTVATSAGLSASAEDCWFQDITLIGTDGITTVETDDGYSARIEYTVKNTQFLSSLITNNNHIQMILPPADFVKISECSFDGDGFAGGIGTSNVFPSGSSNTCIVENCIMEVNSTDNAPNGLTTPFKYFFINVSGTIVMDNVRADMDPTGVGAALVSDFQQFVSLQAGAVKVTNCVIQGPEQEFNVSSNLFAIPGLQIAPSFASDITITDSLIQGALPLQLLGSSAVRTLSVSNNTIMGANPGTRDRTLTAIDIDFADQSVLLDSLKFVNSIDISHNNINNQGDTATGFSPFDVQHTNKTINYDTRGIIQAYAAGYALNISDNNINGVIDIDTSYPSITGVAVKLENGTPSKAFINSNSISVTSFADVDDPDGYVEALYVHSPHAYINNNHISMLLGDAGLSPTGCLYLLIPEAVDTAGPTVERSCIVTGNFFSRSEGLGFGVSFVDSYIFIDAASGSGEDGGMIVDNRFDSPTLDDARTDFNLITDQTTTGWIVERNINQTVTIVPGGSIGSLGISIASGTTANQAGDFSTGCSAAGGIRPFSVFSSHTQFFYGTPSAGSTVRFSWEIYLNDVLPPNVSIVDITFDALTDKNFSATGVFDVVLATGYDGFGVPAVSDTADFTAVTAKTFTLTPPSLITTRDEPMLFIGLQGNDAATFVRCELGQVVPLTIRYRW